MKKRKANIPLSIAEQAMVRLIKVGDLIWKRSDELFAQWELTDTHYNVLRILNGADGPLSQIEIGRKMLSSRANVTKLIDQLEKRKLVIRMACNDRRINHIAITDEGIRFIEDTLDQVMEHAEMCMTSLTKSEQKDLYKILGKFLDELNEK